MVSKSALLSHLLLASVVLAVPPSRLGAPLAPRGENQQSQSLSRVESRAGDTFNIQQNQIWAGASLAGNKQNFSSVTGTFTAPSGLAPSGHDRAVMVFVRIDGANCQNTQAFLATGIELSVNDKNNVSYLAWYQWGPDSSYVFPGNISAGDVVTATVIATSATSGIVIIQNHTAHQSFYKVLNSAHALCEGSPMWIVAGPVDTKVRLADFGTVGFTRAVASGPNGTAYWPSGANEIFQIALNDTLVTLLTIKDDSLMVQYA